MFPFWGYRREIRCGCVEGEKQDVFDVAKFMRAGVLFLPVSLLYLITCGVIYVY